LGRKVRKYFDYYDYQRFTLIFLIFLCLILICMQHILNTTARAIARSPKFPHIPLVLKSLFWLKSNDCIRFNMLTLTYKIILTSQLIYLRSLLNILAQFLIPYPLSRFFIFLLFRVLHLTDHPFFALCSYPMQFSALGISLARWSVYNYLLSSCLCSFFSSISF
jgi:hypothetical protein